MHRQLGGNSPHEIGDRLHNNTGLLPSSRTNISFLHPPPPHLHHHHTHNEQSSSSSHLEDKWSGGGGDLEGTSAEMYEASGGITYRLPDSELDSSRTVSRPELVVEGLQGPIFRNIGI
jgi:hypothetical protein